MTEEKKYDVLAVGDAVIDSLVKADDSFLEQLQLEKNTVTQIDEQKAQSLFSYLDSLKGKEGEVQLEELKDMSGGSAANTAAGLASFGAKVGYVGRVMADEDGKRFFEKLEGRGIDCLTAPAVDGLHTGRSLVIITPDGSRTMCTFIGSKTHEDDIDEEVIKSAKFMFIPAFMMDSEEGKKAMLKAVSLCKEYNVKIALSLSDPACVKRHQHDLLEMVVTKAELVFANMKEIAALVDVPDYELASKAVKALCEKHPFKAVVTLGSKGVEIIAGGQDSMIVDGEKVEAPVDKTGVGALFASGFLYGYMKDMPLEKCGKLGNMAAAEGIKTFGARPMIDLATLLEKLS